METIDIGVSPTALILIRLALAHFGLLAIALLCTLPEKGQATSGKK